MTFVNKCVNGHEFRYELYSKEVFDRKMLVPEVTFFKWRCEECRGKFASARFIDDKPKVEAK